ncbi:MAG: hypothetical protein H0X21_07880 [Actinobacteria bacterium]|nr:hypothetical protein [Actinomycetota bacterium]
MRRAVRPNASQIAIGAAFLAVTVALFVVTDEWEAAPSLAFFLAWIAAHFVYGTLSGSFWTLPVALFGPPLAVALTPYDGYDTPLWIQAGFAAVFYGIPLAFLGVVARRLWQLTRRPVEAEQG